MFPRPTLVTLAVLLLSLDAVRIFYPFDCIPFSTCIFDYSWQIASDDSTKMEFQLSAQTGGWLGLGFSKSGGMADSDITMVSLDPMNNVVLTNRHALIEGEPIIDSPDVNAYSLISATSTNGYLNVTFRRLRDTGASAVNDFSLGTSCPSYFIILAFGAYISGTTYMHDIPGQSDGPFQTSVTVNVCSDTVIGADTYFSFTNSNRAHGAMMLLAWLFFAPAGVLVARYLKPYLPNGRWLLIHRLLQTVASTLTLAAFIVVFTTNKLSVEAIKYHRGVGVTIFSITMIQLLSGIFRNQIAQESKKQSDQKHGPRRWLFSGMHIFFGLALVPLSLANIWLGLDLIGASKATFGFYYACLGLLALAILLGEVLRTRLLLKLSGLIIVVASLAIILCAFVIVVISLAFH